MEENKIEWFDDYDLLKTFHTKEVKIFSIDRKRIIKIQLPTIQDFMDDDDLTAVMTLFHQPISQITESFSFWEPKTYLQFVQLILFEFNHVVEFIPLVTKIQKFLNFIWQNDEVIIDEEQRNITINQCVIDDLLWDYIWYILWKSFGEKRNKPRIFVTEAERLIAQQQEATEERIRLIRSRGRAVSDNKQVSENSLLSTFTVIMYVFKQLSFNFLFNCTNAQINWLQEYAYRISNYEVESKIFASGNSKKKKLKFFTEK